MRPVLRRGAASCVARHRPLWKVPLQEVRDDADDPAGRPGDDLLLSCSHVLLIPWVASQIFVRRRRSELVTTDTDDSAIAAAAYIGFSSPKAAIGMPQEL